jgi:uncharacterized protein YjbI with pentapeptide repeats
VAVRAFRLEAHVEAAVGGGAVSSQEAIAWFETLAAADRESHRSHPGKLGFLRSSGRCLECARDEERRLRRSLRVGQIVAHPSTLAVISGVCGATIGFLINLASGGRSAQVIWIALSFAVLVSLSITAWQVYTQERTGQQWMTMLQEMVFQIYFLTVLADKPEISQIAQQRLEQVLKTLSGDQQVSMLKFFSHNGLPATYIGDALQGSTALVGADLHEMELPGILLENANLSRVNLSRANLSEANLSGTTLYRADLSGANLSRSRLTGTNLRGGKFGGADLTGADLSDSDMGMEKAGRDGFGAPGGVALRPELRTNLSNALLQDAKLRASNLVGADLSGANLRGADLAKANLSGASLPGADLTEANLSEAAFIGADLREADLTGATLTWAILDQADLRTAKVTEEQLKTLGSDKHIKRAP